MREFAIVVAADRKRGIGKDGTLPWKLPGDMAFFKRLTTQTRDEAKLNAVIMGRKTWESIPANFRPLKGRLNVVLSRRPLAAAEPGVLSAASLDDALNLCDRPDIESVFVIGGGAVYSEALRHPGCTRVYLTEIDAEFQCDTFLPPLDSSYSSKSIDSQGRDGEVAYCFAVYNRAR